MNTFLDILGGCAVLITLPMVVGLWKKAFITHTVVASRTTDDGENLTIQSSFTGFKNFGERHEEIQTIMAHGDLRREFVDARFKARIEEEIAKKQPAKLNSV